MSVIEWLLDHMGYGLAAIIGFIVGTFVAFVLELTGTGQWIAAAVGAVVFFGLLFLDWLSDAISRLFGFSVEGIIRKGMSPEQRAKAEREKRRDRKASRLSFAIGFVLALMITRLVEAESVLDWIT